MPASVHIYNATSLGHRQLEEVIQTTSSVLQVPATLRKNMLNIELAFDRSRRQYNSTVLLEQLLASAPSPKYEKNLAIVDVDLYIPVLTFVFGEAQLDGRAAIVSTHRLSNQFYGLRENPNSLLDRLVKEVIHELGHTFGLLLCKQFECVMRSSTYVEEIDLKRSHLCQDCKELLHSRLARHGNQAEN